MTPRCEMCGGRGWWGVLALVRCLRCDGSGWRRDVVQHERTEGGWE